MKIQFWSIGKSHEPYVKEGVEMFTKRIGNYFPVQWHLLPSPKNSAMLSAMDLKHKESEMLLSFIEQDDYLILLDEKGKQINSEGLATFIQQRANESEKKIIFLIGGSFGVSDAIIKRADFMWSLSNLVFPHQLVRMILAEQVYRACTILRNEKYHHV